ncbi:hypothetical protein LV82_01399 [Albidovulum inexpectatum]|uniref:DUF5681 domain-containing protein n=1 Tax=Albidovulum inexpectatum TaxID=196587 RepID=A0A2S5JIU9_9RHOB|nr:DUF5681 domain-containing protein [Albidovulum inexpectatum]PPB81352.1 hypothetical protein LV82_01399 [Albidovulum inexpectatum]
MAERKTDYEVGYRKPPKHTRFRKGQSGNPKGRPKGARGLTASLKRELETKITIREGNRELRLTKGEAMAKRLTNDALTGDKKALLALLKLDPQLYGTVADQVEEAGKAAQAEPVDFEILRDYFGQSEKGAATDTAEEGADDEA